MLQSYWIKIWKSTKWSIRRHYESRYTSSLKCFGILRVCLVTEQGFKPELIWHKIASENWVQRASSFSKCENDVISFQTWTAALLKKWFGITYLHCFQISQSDEKWNECLMSKCIWITIYFSRCTELQKFKCHFHI